MQDFKPLTLALAVASLFSQSSSFADALAQPLPFVQNWSNTALIATSDDWSGVPGIVGYRGDGLTAATGIDPQTILADGIATPVDVNANQAAPNTFTTGGVAEFQLADPVVALQGSGTADAPFIVVHLNTVGLHGIRVAYDLRDIDGSGDNAVQPVALQYRVGDSGNFSNVPSAFVADASSGPGIASLVTPVGVTLPADADNQPLLELRIITTNAAGSDEWVGVDNLSVTGTSGSAFNQAIVATCPAGVAAAQGTVSSFTLNATDADSVVNAATITSGAIPGIALGAFTPAVGDGGVASVSLDVAASVAAGSYPLQITFGNNEVQTTTCSVTLAVAAITPIPAIQGSGAISPRLGQTLLTQGVVTDRTNNGFFMQDEPATATTRPPTASLSTPASHRP
jgi:hypothetical protein